MCGYAFSLSHNLAVQHWSQAQFITAGRIYFFQRLLNLFSSNLGKKTERAQVNAEDGNVRLRHASRRGKQCTVAAQHNHKIGGDAGEIFTFCGLAVRTEFARGAISRDGVAMIAEPARDL